MMTNRMPNKWPLSLALCATFASSFAPRPVHAHISMMGALQARGGDEKQSPCDGNRGDGPVYTFAPGATITLAVNEVIPHPSYFRIAFDDDGADFVEPRSIKPISTTRACPFDANDQCGESDFCTEAGAAEGAIVLWDNLDPHLASAARGGTWNIKLPDIECDNCTLQVIQVMEDTIHGAYCPQGTCAASAQSLEDIYHRCIDIMLVAGAPSGPGQTTAAVDNNGMECDPATGGNAGTGGGGAGAAAGSGGMAAGGAGGSGAAAGSSGSTSNAGTGGMPSAGGAGGAPAGVGGAPAGAAGISGGAGTGGVTAMPPVIGGGAAGTTAPTGSTDTSGCSVAAPRSGLPSRTFVAWFLLMLVALAARRSFHPRSRHAQASRS